MTMKKAIITTGGTGGHIFPALAVAAELQERNPGVEILFMGGSGPEGDLAQKAGLQFKELPARGIMGRGLKGLLGGMAWLGMGIPKAMLAVMKFNPDVVIGFGGYAGFCPVLAASFLGIPSAVHEQNSVPGMTNKTLGKFVKQIFLSFPDTLNVFKASKTTLVGNPVRSDILDVPTKRQNRKTGKHVLVLGGSQGARPINDGVIDALPQLAEAGVTLTHQAGKGDFDRTRSFYEAVKADPTQVYGFIEDMGAEYSKADLIICRSGASTVFEIAAAGVPAIFVPFPQATHDHQTMNAKAMCDTGASLLLPQNGLSGDSLAEMVLELLDKPEQLATMELAARDFAKANAATDIAMGLEALAT